MPQAFVLQVVGHVLLRGEVTLVVVRIFVAVAVAEVFHERRRSVAQVQGYGQVAGLAHLGESVVDAEVGRVALGRCGEIDARLCQCDACLGPANLHDGVEGGIGEQQCVGVGESDVLGGRDDHAAGNELRVFPTLYHACHPVEGGVGVAATDALDEGGDDVVVHLAVLVVGQGVLLQALLDEGVGDDQR